MHNKQFRILLHVYKKRVTEKHIWEGVKAEIQCKLKLHLAMLNKHLSKVEIPSLVPLLCGGYMWYLDVLGGFKAIQLIQQFQHCPLHLTVTTWAALQTGWPDWVDLVHEDDGRSVFSRHDEQLTHHTSAWWERAGSRLRNQFWQIYRGWKSIWWRKKRELLTLSYEFLYKLRARHSDEGTVSVVGYSSGQQGLPCTWGTIQQHTLHTFKANQNHRHSDRWR